MCGTPAFTRLVIDKLRTTFQVSEESKDKMMLVGQLIGWIDKTKPGGYIKVSQDIRIEELEAMVFDRTQKDQEKAADKQHTQYRSVLGQTNWLQSRTQFHS